jgi:hypothetical protein
MTNNQIAINHCKNVSSIITDLLLKNRYDIINSIIYAAINGSEHKLIPVGIDKTDLWLTLLMNTKHHKDMIASRVLLFDKVLFETKDWTLEEINWVANLE